LLPLLVHVTVTEPAVAATSWAEPTLALDELPFALMSPVNDPVNVGSADPWSWVSTRSFAVVVVMDGPVQVEQKV
jgi:hypothetical protein